MEPCPSDGDLAGYLEGQGAGWVGAHLRRCPLCQEAVDRLSDVEALRPAAASLAARDWDWDEHGDARLRSIVETLRNESPFDTRSGPSDDSRPRAFPLEPSIEPGRLGRLGPYEVEEEVGRGGMGIVFRARDRTTGRVVALKVLHAGDDDSKTRRRFLQEVRATARVEHDHVVRLYATGDPEARVPYFVMEYLPGPSLAERVRGRPRIGAREAAEVVAQVADGLHAAHLCGLVHGDVKPANILIDASNGRAKIGDFGLARLWLEEPSASRERLMPGTPAYLSPEQARGESSTDSRADIYSLGVTLYEALTGEVPFRGEPHRILDQVLKDDPRAPRVYDDAIPRDLETICLKAMAKEPSRRYPTASAFADDLRRFLRGEAILARPVGPLERAWRWCRNNRRVAGLSALAGSLMLALAVGSTIAAVRISRERDKTAGQARLAAEQARLADIRGGLAIDAFNALIEGVQDKLASRPGTLELRRSLLEIARAGLGRVTAGDPALDRSRVDERGITSLIKLGDLDLLLGRTTEARAEFDEAARMAERLASANPGAVAAGRTLASAYDRLGDLFKSKYQAKDAGALYEKASEIRRRLADGHPGDAILRRDLRVSLAKLADRDLAISDLPEARGRLEAYLRALLDEPPETANTPLRLKDLRYIHGRIGTLAQRQGRKADALAAHRRSLDHAEALCSLDPEDLDASRQRAWALNSLGSACLTFGDLEGAEVALTAFRDDRASASRGEPSNLEVLRAFALALQGLGDLATRRGDFDEATSQYLQASSVFDDLARRNPTSVGAHKDRLIVRRKLASMEGDRDHFEPAASWLDRELEIQAGKDVPAHPDQSGWIDEAKILRDIFRLAPRAIDHPEIARDQPPPVRDLLQKVRAFALARSGRVEEAAEAAGELLAIPDTEGGSLIAARTYALIADSLAGRDPEARGRFVGLAVEAARRAIEKDPPNAGSVQYDPYLGAIRDEPRFRALFARDRPR